MEDHDSARGEAAGWIPMPGYLWLTGKPSAASRSRLDFPSTPTDLKSGMPEAVLMPAPVWNTTLEDCQTSFASSHTFRSNSSGGSKICCVREQRAVM